MENIPERKLKVLLLYRTFGPSVNLCGYIQLKWLADHGRVEFRDKRIMDVKKRDLEWCEIAVFVRGDALLDEWMAKVCHKAGKTVVYILDDDLLNVPITMGSGPYYAQKSVKHHIRRMMEYSDYFMSPSSVGPRNVSEAPPFSVSVSPSYGTRGVSLRRRSAASSPSLCVSALM